MAYEGLRKKSSPFPKCQVEEETYRLISASLLARRHTEILLGSWAMGTRPRREKTILLQTRLL